MNFSLKYFLTGIITGAFECCYIIILKYFGTNTQKVSSSFLYDSRWRNLFKCLIKIERFKKLFLLVSSKRYGWHNSSLKVRIAKSHCPLQNIMNITSLADDFQRCSVNIHTRNTIDSALQCIVQCC